MKAILTTFSLALFLLMACSETRNEKSTTDMQVTKTPNFQTGYAQVNGMEMYYEIYLPADQARRQGSPLVLIHGGGSTIQSTFERVIPLLAKNRKLIAVELQAHGRTSDRNADLSFEQDADDVVTLLHSLDIRKADFLGFSNGGTTTLQIAIRHPEIVNKIILGSALAKRNGMPEQFWGFMEQASLDNMPEPLKEAYRKVSSDPNGLQVMHDRDAKRMVNFQDIPDDQIRSIQAPALIIVGDKDVITPEHAIEMSRQLTNARLAILPGVHGEYLGEVTTLKPDFKASDLVAVPLIEGFLGERSERAE